MCLRSACLSQLGMHREVRSWVLEVDMTLCGLESNFESTPRSPQALLDAEVAVKLAPSWSKGYSRKAAAHFFLKDFDKA